MHSRESSCRDWESRLQTVEVKYSTEFGKMNDEMQRLALWESELLTFESSLQAREQHLNTVERNLSEYLAPFNDSTVNGSQIIDSSILASPQAGNLLHSKLTDDQRRRLNAFATPILQRRSQPIMTPTDNNITNRKTTAATPTATATVLSPSVALYSPTQAEISFVDGTTTSP